MPNDFEGKPLVPGVNADKVNVAAGMKRAIALGFGDATAQMVIEYALMRHRRGEEDGAERTFLREYPHDLTSWKVILAEAITEGSKS